MYSKYLKEGVIVEQTLELRTILKDEMAKCVPIHGIKFSEPIALPISIDERRYNIVSFWPYESYKQITKEEPEIFINAQEMKQCDTVAVFNTRSNNTLEIFDIKILISAIYFGNRLADTAYYKERNIEDMLRCSIEVYEEVEERKLDFADENDRNVIAEMRKNAERKYMFDDERNDEFFRNYNLTGYWNDKNRICNLSWYVKIGNMGITKDDFDSKSTRVFTYSLCDEFGRQAQVFPESVIININATFLDKLKLLLDKLNGDDEYGKKVKSACRLYYDCINENDIDDIIISYSTILETLLLGKNEDNQRKKVAVRSACLIGDGRCKKKKEFIANRVYYFYKYRNSIVHDGKAFTEFDDDILFSYTLIFIKHVIFFVIKGILEFNIQDSNGIKDIVERNFLKDKLSKGFDYITYNEDINPNIPIIYQ